MASSSRGKESVGEQHGTLSLYEADEVEVSLGEGDDTTNPIEEVSFSLVGSLLTERTIKFTFMKDTLASLWRPGRGMMAKEVATNLYQFIFFHEKDMQRILDDDPWSYEQNLLILQRLGHQQSPFDVALLRADFWVQVHKIPHRLVNKKTAEAVGTHLGSFVKADISKFDGSWSAFIRVRAGIDVTKPLKKGVRIRISPSQSFWLEYKYERLPTYCFTCGKIGHAQKHCPKQFEDDYVEGENMYGPELRAAGRRTLAQRNRWLLDEPPTKPIGTEEPLSGNVKRPGDADWKPKCHTALQDDHPVVDVKEGENQIDVSQSNMQEVIMPVENRKKRKWVAEMDEPADISGELEENSEGYLIQKNGLTAGAGCQARSEL